MRLSAMSFIETKCSHTHYMENSQMKPQTLEYLHSKGILRADER